MEIMIGSKKISHLLVAWGTYYSIFYIIMFSIMMFFAQGSQVRWLQSFRKNNYFIKSRINFLLYLLEAYFLSVTL